MRVEDAGVAECDIASGWRLAFAYNRRGEVASATIAGNAATYAYDDSRLRDGVLRKTGGKKIA